MFSFFKKEDIKEDVKDNSREELVEQFKDAVFDLKNIVAEGQDDIFIKRARKRRDDLISRIEFSDV